MGKKAKKDRPVAIVSVLSQADGSFGVDIDSDLSPETLAALLRSAADSLEGVVDRASGAWGRP